MFFSLGLSKQFYVSCLTGERQLRGFAICNLQFANESKPSLFATNFGRPVAFLGGGLRSSHVIFLGHGCRRGLLSFLDSVCGFLEGDCGRCFVALVSAGEIDGGGARADGEAASDA